MTGIWSRRSLTRWMSVARRPRRYTGISAGRAGNPRNRRSIAQARLLGPVASWHWRRHSAGVDILPLFARSVLRGSGTGVQAGREQREAYCVATNVAETSLTVPGIRYVIDTGAGARLNRYSYRNKVEQLRDGEDFARFRQPAGRTLRPGDEWNLHSSVCGRRLSFPTRVTDPEILRSSLAAVILRMKSLKMGSVENFPFLDPPLPRMIVDGYQLLAELGAVDEATC